MLRRMRDNNISAVTRGGAMGAVKLRLYLKSLRMEKVFLGGEILGRGYKRAVDERKIENLQKKVVKKFLG